MNRWKMVMISGAAAAALMLGGCGEHKEKSTVHETTAQAETAVPAAAPAESKPVESAVSEAAEAQAPAPAAEESAATPAPAAEAATQEARKKVEAVQKSVESEAKKAEESATQAAEETKKAVDAAVLYTKCAGCHGMKGEKHALGQSNIIAGQSKEELVKKIEGYQNGTYGGAMKGLMTGQVKNLTPEEVEALADYISRL